MKLIDKFMNWIGFEKSLGANNTVKWRRKRQQETVAQQAVNGKPIEYLLNDMTTPGLVKNIQSIVSPAAPRFGVKNFQGGGFPRNSVQANAANCYVTVTNTLNFYDKFTGRDGIKPLRSWAGTGMLAVIPRAGVDLNAFYNRKSMQFFYYNDPTVRRIVSTADSSDIVAHELGHAILDSNRPDTWSAASLEVWSFHEAFADLTALLHIMSYDEILIRSLEECNNDITKQSVMTKLAEDVGRAIFTVSGPRSGRHPHYLRSVINNFKYTDPAKLGKQAPHNKLAAECHSFGRIFLGAYYDFLVAVYQDTLSQGQSPLNSLKHARDVTAQYALRAIQNVALNVKFYDSMARTLMWVAKHSDKGRYFELMRKAMIDRKIVGAAARIKMMSAPPVPDEGESIVKIQSTQTVKLSDHIGISAMSNNPLYNVEVEIPMEESFLYDDEGVFMDSIYVSVEDSYLIAQDFINFLHETNSVGDTLTTPFEIQNGKLVRTYIE